MIFYIFHVCLLASEPGVLYIAKIKKGNRGLSACE
jgi:hypothetical protein